ncbi:MAG: hypothetical protein WAT27_11320 [Chitinophagales bacterium]
MSVKLGYFGSQHADLGYFSGETAICVNVTFWQYPFWVALVGA